MFHLLLTFYSAGEAACKRRPRSLQPLASRNLKLRVPKRVLGNLVGFAVIATSAYRGMGQDLCDKGIKMRLKVLFSYF